MVNNLSSVNCNDGMMQCRSVRIRAEANAAARITADQSGALLHSVLWFRLRSVSTVPLHHHAACSDAVRLPWTNLRANIPRHIHALRSLNIVNFEKFVIYH